MTKRHESLNLRALGAGCAAALATVALAACGGGYDQGEAESTIVDKLSGQVDSAVGSPITSASCPDDVELEAGTTFDCTATLENGDELKVSAEITDDDGNATFNISPEELKSAG
jgi:hypothetical protein